MKITNIKTFLVDGYLLVRVYTDSGIAGNGEAGLWAYHRTVKTAIEEIAEYYIGKDPLQIEFHAQVVTRNTHFRGAALNAANPRSCQATRTAQPPDIATFIL